MVVICTSSFSNKWAGINQLIFLMVKYGVLFEVRAEFLNNITQASASKG
jgi:hypothetical protein